MNAATIKDVFRRKASAIARRPGFARSFGHALVRLVAGYACEVEHEDGKGRSLRLDLPPAEGGAGSGPHPDQLMRACLGADLAMGYRTWGARLDVDVAAVEVSIDCESDVRGQLGLDPSVPVGWQRLRVDVAISSAAAAADVRRVVATADRLSPMLANLSPAIARTHRLTIHETTRNERTR